MAEALPDDLRWLAQVLHAADMLAALSLDPEATREDAAALVRDPAAVAPVPALTVALIALIAGCRDPIFERTAPAQAAESLLRLFFFLAPVRSVTLWITTPDGAVHPVAHLGGSRPTHAMRHAALRTVSGWLPADRGSIIRCLALRVGDDLAGSLTVRPLLGQRDRAVAFAEQVVEPLVSVLARATALEQVPNRQRTAVAAAERRLRRIGLDLHDGPLQSAAVLHGEIALFRSQFAAAEAAADTNRLLEGRFDDLEARVAELEAEMREIAESCTDGVVPRLPLQVRLRDLVAAFERRGPIVASLELDGDFAGLTPSQELALFHIVQEALSNIREHSGAKLVRVSARAVGGSVEAQVVDDGHGFDVAGTFEAGMGRRLGLAGMAERARLLGGTVRVESALGGPTTITVELSAWRAPGGARPPGPA